MTSTKKDPVIVVLQLTGAGSGDEAVTGTRVGEMLALVGATTEYQFG